MLVWLRFACPARPRGVGSDGGQVSPEVWWSPAAREALLTSSAQREATDAGLSAGSAATDWHQRFRQYDQQVRGVALVRAGAVVHPLDVLTPSEVAASDFWKARRIGDVPLMRLHVDEAASLPQPRLISVTAVGQVARALFVKMTTYSFDALVAAQANAERPLDIAALAQRWGGMAAEDVLDASGRALVCCCLPVSHALALTSRVWKSWLIPLCGGRMAAGLGLHHVARLWRQLQPDLPAERYLAVQHAAKSESLDDVDLFAPAELLEFANDLRRLHAAQPSDALGSRIMWLERRRDVVLRRMSLQTARAYEIEFLVSSLLVSGFLRSLASHADAIRCAVSVGVSDAALRKHILSALDAPRGIPSASTLRRHRLTCHIGFCCWEQSLSSDMVLRGDFVRYGTVDSSPQGPYDFVLHGARTLSGNSVLQAARDSERLHDDSLPEDEKKLIAERLRSALLLTQGAPCAVGAGRQSLARKVHAVVHSTRMYSSSWRAAVSLMNGTFTWTGDHGVESGFWLFRKRMKNLFGPWPMEADAMPDDEDPKAHRNNEKLLPVAQMFPACLANIHMGNLL